MYLFPGITEVLSDMFPVYQMPLQPEPNLTVFNRWNWTDETVEGLQIALAQTPSDAIRGVSQHMHILLHRNI
jgi:hypothetical protein